jgi:hypothetical protein
LRARAERAESEANRQEREAEAEYLQQEAEIHDIMASCQRMELVVFEHLQSIRQVVLADNKTNTL